MFKDEFLSEWRRLNPRYVRPGDGFWRTVAHAAREALPGYFAPLRIGLWLIARWLPRGVRMFNKRGETK